MEEKQMLMACRCQFDSVCLCDGWLSYSEVAIGNRAGVLQGSRKELDLERIDNMWKVSMSK